MFGKEQLRRPVAAITGLISCFCYPCGAAAVELGPFDIGGVVRVNLLTKSWETREQRFPLERFEFDTAFPNIHFESGRVSFGMQYRYYYYAETGRDTSFLHDAWLGYDLPGAGDVRAGVTKVPFGVLPFASNNYFFSLAYYVGLEDDYDLGVTYDGGNGPWRWQFGYFLGDEGSFHGVSPDSARYSYDVVSDGVTDNDEADQVNARLERDVPVRGLDNLAVGLSLQYGRIPNRTTDRTGENIAAAIHAAAGLGRWSFKWESAYYDYNLENPDDQPDDRVIMGAYDFAYQVAAKGHLHSLSLAYTAPVEADFLDSVSIYNDYSVLFKPAAGFRTSQQNVTGAALDFDGPLLIYVDFALGKNNAWIGPDFGTALGPGGSDGWDHRFNINAGLYF